jgi:release factor glutamine methyltransferase
MAGAFSRLPAHEQRRLRRLGVADLEALARRRLGGEPLQYIEGSAAFTDFEVEVDSRVLVPRPETEGLLELAVTAAVEPGVIVDLGTGSGVLAIALARRFPGADVHGVDTSRPALEVAVANARRLGVDISFHLGHLFEALPPALVGSVDLVVSNPPYVSEAEWDDLPADVRREPRQALVAGPEGTETLLAIAGSAPRWLRPGGLIVCEIGEKQAGRLLPAFTSVGQVEVRRDLAGRDRYLLVRCP